jgi:3-hydroxyisobutyrate dehydrogenase-like beta-hydroxyacid dehydrogenase
MDGHCDRAAAARARPSDTSTLGAAAAVDLLADSNISAGILHVRAARIVAALNGEASGLAAFDVDTMRRDLRYMVKEAAAHGASLPSAGRAFECFDRASREGNGGVDGVADPTYWIAQ